VGENYFASGSGEEVNYGEVFKSDPAAEKHIRARLAALRQSRDNAAVERSLDRLESAASTQSNLMPYLIDCCHAYATVGEMVARLKGAWGEFREPINL
jgi:methylmalonyl-CoA mutase N-terminal domain/subunit